MGPARRAGEKGFLCSNTGNRRKEGDIMWHIDDAGMDEVKYG